jgi:hypothetical protein
MGLMKMTVSVSGKIKNRVKRLESGRMVIINDFLDISDRDTAKLIINRLVKEGVLNRAYNGVYYKPKINKLFNLEVPPTDYIILKNIARKNNQHIVAAGNTALNLVGLSTQVPMIYEYITDGPSRTVTLKSGLQNHLRHSGTKKFFENDEVNLTFEILSYLDDDDIDDQVLSILARRHDDRSFKDLVTAADKSTDRLRKYVTQMIGGDLRHD